MAINETNYQTIFQLASTDTKTCESQHVHLILSTQMLFSSEGRMLMKYY